MTHIYYLTLLVLTGVGSSIMTLYAPTMLAHIRQYFTRKKHTSTYTLQQDVEHLKEIVRELSKHSVEDEIKMADLQSQINNVAESVAHRDKHRKHNIRRDVRDYLEELRTDK